LVDEHGTVLWLSHGDDLHEPGQIVGKKTWDLVPEDERSEVRDLFANVIFDDGKGERLFTSRFVDARPQYCVRMQRVSQVSVVTLVQRVLPPTVTAREKEILRLIANDVKPQQIGKKTPPEPKHRGLVPAQPEAQTRCDGDGRPGALGDTRRTDSAVTPLPPAASAPA
jgi:hypothetical protein